MSRPRDLWVVLAVALVTAACQSPEVASGGQTESSIGIPQETADGTVFSTGERTTVPGTSARPTTSDAAPATASASTSTSPSTSTTTTTTTAVPLVGWEAVDSYLRTTIIGGGSDALSAAVMRDGDLVYAGASGSRVPGGNEPALAEHRFRIASISKIIAAITMLQLVEEGAIGLDDPVGSMLASALGLQDVPVQVLGITVRQLLTHRSGFPQYENLFFANGVPSCLDAATVGLTGPLQSIPGTAFQYSNMNFCLIGLTVELLSQQSYAQAVDDRLLTPLGISGMRLAGTFDVGAGDIEHRSRAGRNYMETLGAAGAWIATASDVVVITNALDLSTPGWKPLEAPTLELMKTITIDPPAPVTDVEPAASTTTPSPQPTTGYGMGLMIFGPGSFGHTGTIESTHAMTVRRPDGYTWAITVSGEYPSSTKVLADIMDNALLLGGFIDAPFVPTPPPIES